MSYHDQDDVIGFCADYRHPYGCQDAVDAEGVWLDQIPYEPEPVICISCGERIDPIGAMIKWVGGKALIPLCRTCFDAPPAPDPGT